jgi:predicted dehydrogenase
MQPINLAIAGLGFMGATHVRAALALDNIRLVAVVGPEEKRLEGDFRDVGGNLGVKFDVVDFSNVRKYRRIEDALADPGIDAFDLCLPTDLHAKMTVAALRGGKHVLVEKPMALNNSDTAEMLRESEGAGKILMTGQVLRFFPAYAEARRMVRNGDLGRIRMSWFRRHCAAPAWGDWIHNSTRSGGGIFDLLIHDVDFSIALFGEPKAITAVGSAGGGEKDLNGLLSAMLHYADHGPAIIEGGWHAQGPHPFSMSFTISGEEGTLEFSSAGRPLTLSRKGAAATELVTLPECDGFQEELRYFADCAASNRIPERCLPRESAAAVKVALSMLDATAHSRTNS